MTTSELAGLAVANASDHATAAAAVSDTCSAVATLQCSHRFRLTGHCFRQWDGSIVNSKTLLIVEKIAGSSADVGFCVGGLYVVAAVAVEDDEEFEIWKAASAFAAAVVVAVVVEFAAVAA